MARLLSFIVSVLALAAVIMFAHPDAAPANGLFDQQPARQGAICVRNSDCAAPLVCHSPRCVVECREDRDCNAGAHCIIDRNGVGSCTLNQPASALAPDAPYCVSQRDCTSGSCSRTDDQCH